MTYLKESIKKITNEIHDCFGNISLFATGGLDSRLVLASFTTGEKVRIDSLIYGRSNDFWLPTRSEDEDVVKELSYITGLPYYVLDWTSPEKEIGIDLDWQYYLASKVGINNHIYCGNRKFVETIKDANSPFVEFGYFLESIRLREWVEKANTADFSLDSYIKRYFGKFDCFGYDNTKEFYSWVRDAYEETLTDHGIDGAQRIPMSIANIFEWVCRERYTDSRMHQFVNNYRYSFPIFALPEIHEFILLLPMEEKCSARFQIELIRSLDEKLLKASVFSHRRKCRINANGEKVMIFNLKNILTNLMYMFPTITNRLLPIWQKKHHKSGIEDNNVFMKELRSMERNCKRLKKPLINHGYNANISHLFVYRQALIALSLLNEEDSE